MYPLDLEKLIPAKRLRTSRAVRSKSDHRHEFESDASRATFCAAVRRMHDKTQVFPLTTGDYVHTRLTHSQEVQQIAQSLGVSFCRSDEFREVYKDNAHKYETQICTILGTAGLLHDVGNPPFGHCAEEVISDYFAKSDLGSQYLALLQNEDEKLDFLNFDGNAEGFRVITKLQYLGDTYGLNLSLPVLGSYLKYPNYSKCSKKYVGLKKHGVFTSESKYLEEIANTFNLHTEDGRIKRYPFSFLVEAADTICYRTMDVEDGLSMGWLSLDEVCTDINAYVNDHVEAKCFEPEWLENGKFSIQKMLHLEDTTNLPENYVKFRVGLVRHLVEVAFKNFVENLDKIDSGEYSQELLDGDTLHIEEALKSVEISKLFCLKDVVMAEMTGSSVIKGLLDLTLPRIFANDRRLETILPQSMLRAVHEECGLYNPKEDKEFKTQMDKVSPYYKLRLIVDWIAGMTDQYAVHMFRKLNGTNL